jgi:hypothetical protein
MISRLAHEPRPVLQRGTGYGRSVRPDWADFVPVQRPVVHDVAIGPGLIVEALAARRLAAVLTDSVLVPRGIAGIAVGTNDVGEDTRRIPKTSSPPTRVLSRPA